MKIQEKNLQELDKIFNIGNISIHSYRKYFQDIIRFKDVKFYYFVGDTIFYFESEEYEPREVRDLLYSV